MNEIHVQQKVPEAKADLINISVVIPVYCVEDYVEECLQSVMDQSLQELEVICINDGSSDESWKKVRKLAEKDRRIILLQNEENKGLSYSRNYGLRKAHGKYIYFLDADDKIKAEAMECLFQEAEKHNLDVILFDAELVYEKPEFVKENKDYIAQREENYDGVWQGRRLLAELMKNHEWTPSVPRQFWRKDFLLAQELYFYEGIIHEDELFSLKAMFLAQKVMFMPKRFFIRRFRENSIMTGKNEKQSLIGYFTIYYRMNQYIYQSGIHLEPITAYLAKLYNRLARMYQQYPEKLTLAEEFSETELKNAFYFFASIQNADKAYGNITNKNIDLIRHAKHVYIFGAGIIARHIFFKLIEKEIIINGFIVTSLKENAAAYMGHPVIELQQLDCGQQDAIIVIAVGKKFRNEIKTKLCSAGLSSIIYDEDSDQNEGKETMA